MALTMEDHDLQLATQLGHEPEGVNTRSIWGFAACLVGTIVLSFVLVWILLRQLVALGGTEGVPPAQQVPMPENVPRLDANQLVEARRLFELERDLLTEYGWVDQATGVARIPIERAMALLSERGLASVNRAETEAATTTEALTSQPADAEQTEPAEAADTTGEGASEASDGAAGEDGVDGPEDPEGAAGEAETSEEAAPFEQEESSEGAQLAPAEQPVEQKK